MASQKMNGLQAHYEIAGDAESPLVPVHGSWNSRESWNLVAQGLARSFRIVSYDRPGHGQSAAPAGP